MVFGLANFQNKKGRIILRHPSCCRWQPAPLAGARRRLRRRRSGPPALVQLAVPVVLGGRRGQAQPARASAGPFPAGQHRWKRWQRRPTVRGPPSSLSCGPDGSTTGGPPWPRLVPNRPAVSHLLTCLPSFPPLPATAAAGHSVGAVGGGASAAGLRRSGRACGPVTTGVQDRAGLLWPLRLQRRACGQRTRMKCRSASAPRLLEERIL